MSDTELVLTMLAPDGFSASMDVARQGGEVAGVARTALETRTDQPVITSQNAAQLSAVVTEMIEVSAQVVDRPDKLKSE